MGVWAEVEGAIYLHESEHMSLRKSIMESFDEVNLYHCSSSLLNDIRKHEFKFAFSEDGIRAANLVELFIAQFSWRKKFSADVSAEVRFLK